MSAIEVLRLPLRPFSWVGARVRGRFRAWWQARVPRSDTLVLTQRNIYIVPTHAGFMFAVTLIVLLLASVNYQLNLGYVLTFLLAGSGIVSMHITHNTLRGLRLHLRAPLPVFAGEAALLDAVLTSPARPRFGIGLRTEAAGDASAWSWVDVPAGAQASARVSFVPQARGLHELPTLLVETRFPLGLFRAWTVWRPAAQVLVYPQPEKPAAALPPAHAVGIGPASGRRAGAGETEGVRPYRRGDPLKLVVWKKVAKYAASSGEMVSRDTSGSVHRELWLDYQASALPGVDQRLSRLAAWVIAAENGGIVYGLKLQGVEIAPAHGEAHRRKCLEALALWS
jgi:uncharacterized protein (DUF58 family)